MGAAAHGVNHLREDTVPETGPAWPLPPPGSRGP